MNKNLFAIEILIEPDFISTELALVCDVFRIANRLSDEPLYEYTLTTSENTTLVEGIGGICAHAESISCVTKVPDLLIVLGGAGLTTRFSSIMARIARIKLKGSRSILLSDAASEWAKRQDRNVKATTHWENQIILNTLRPDLYLNNVLFENRTTVTTSAGMLSTADVLLDFVAKHHSFELANDVSRVLVMDYIRAGGSPQRGMESDSPGIKNNTVREAIYLMENNIEVPLRISEIASCVGLSVRQIERNFQNHINSTPLAYYRRLRTNRARMLLGQTNLSLIEIAVCCGFSAPASLKISYQREFGMTPIQFRQRGRLLQHSAMV